jgi:hypothetical protein
LIFGRPLPSTVAKNILSDMPAPAKKGGFHGGKDGVYESKAFGKGKAKAALNDKLKRKRDYKKLLVREGRVAQDGDDAPQPERKPRGPKPDPFHFANKERQTQQTAIREQKTQDAKQRQSDELDRKRKSKDREKKRGKMLSKNRGQPVVKYQLESILAKLESGK